MKTNFTTKTFAYLLLKGNFLASKNGLIYLMLLFSLMSQGQSVGDYRTKATGNWNATTTWETWNGSAWVESGFPTSTNNITATQSPLDGGNGSSGGGGGAIDFSKLIVKKM